MLVAKAGPDAKLELTTNHVVRQPSSHEVVVVAISRHNLSSNGTMEFGSLLGTTDGAVSVLCPITSSSHVRLLALQNVMTHL